MATKPVFPLLMSMALPPMLSMLLGSLYNIIDSMFVARYSADALTAVSLAFPLQNFALAVSVGAGVGISSYIARKLGEGDRTRPTAPWLTAAALAGPLPGLRAAGPVSHKAVSLPFHQLAGHPQPGGRLSVHRAGGLRGPAGADRH